MSGDLAARLLVGWCLLSLLVAVAVAAAAWRHRQPSPRPVAPGANPAAHEARVLAALLDDLATDDTCRDLWDAAVELAHTPAPSRDRLAR